MRLLIAGLCLAIALAAAVAAGLLLAPVPAAPSQPAASDVADKPSPRVDLTDPRRYADFISSHEQLTAKAKRGGIDLYFVGDSITSGWHARGKAVWAKEFAAWRPGNFGVSGDCTQHALWRLENSELDGVSPKVFVVMIGTNNLSSNTNDQIVAGNAAIIKKIAATNPQAKVLLLGLFPRWMSRQDRRLEPRIAQINAGLAKLDDRKNVKFMDIGDNFLANGELPQEVMPDGLHLSEKGYQIWARAIKPVLTEWLGAPPAK